MDHWSTGNRMRFCNPYALPRPWALTMGSHGALTGASDLSDLLPPRLRPLAESAHLCDPPSRVLQPRQAPQQLVGKRQVVGSKVGTMIEDRGGALGRFGVGDG